MGQVFKSKTISLKAEPIMNSIFDCYLRYIDDQQSYHKNIFAVKKRNALERLHIQKIKWIDILTADGGIYCKYSVWSTAQVRVVHPNTSSMLHMNTNSE